MKLKREREERVFKVYLTDALFAIANDRQIKERWVKIDKDIKTPADVRSAAEIKQKILSKINGEEG